MFFIEKSKKISSEKELESATIDWLRFPLALAVVFIHNKGSKGIDLNFIHSNPISLEAIYDFMRIFFSNTVTHFAVPTFFMFSGFLFFYNIKEWNKDVYKSKLKKRFKSLLIPYLLWNLLFIGYLEIVKLCGVVLNGNPISSLYEFIFENGGIHMFWDCTSYANSNTNWLGMPIPTLSVPIMGPLWFLRDLIVVVLFTPVIYYLIKKFKIIIIIVLGFLYVSDIFISVPGFSITCFFWFSLGAFYSIHNNNMINSIRKFQIPSYCIAIITLIPLVWFNGNVGDGITTNPFVQILYRIYVMSAVFSVVSISSFLLKKHIAGLNKNLSKTSFFIFATHILIISYVGKLLNIFVPETNYYLQSIVYLITPIITAFICTIIFNFMSKYSKKLLSILVGSRL